MLISDKNAKNEKLLVLSVRELRHLDRHVPYVNAIVTVVLRNMQFMTK